MKYKMKLCPFLRATRAGQKAIAIQMMKNRIPQSHQFVEANSNMTISPYLGG
jgi:hypothetical protein